MAGCPALISQLIIPFGFIPSWQSSVQQLREHGVAIYVECRDVREFSEIQVPNIDGVILKGNESGGSVSGTTSFVLCQQWQRFVQQHPEYHAIPYWIRGGVGEYSVAAAVVAGATGVVLDSQLLLARESRVPENIKSVLRAMDGGESLTVGARLGCETRLLPAPGSTIVAELSDLEDDLSTSDLPIEERQSHLPPQSWRTLMNCNLAGQSFAVVRMRHLPHHWRNATSPSLELCSGLLHVLMKTYRVPRTNPRYQRTPHWPVSMAHGFPILQGPMTRVSDVAAFADAVANAGALPFLALSLLREQQVESLMQECGERLGDRSWGVGLLGFLPPVIRQEQVRTIRKCRPHFAIIAGGRPDQATQLEEDGIVTYLHVPSPGLLRMFIRQGARQFVLEGRECGGHVGPRSSFILWEQQIALLLQHISSSGGATEFHVVFAGGIHDAQSAAMVAAMAAPLVAKGVKIGILMGTAYLFTHEAVETGAIVSRFQDEALTADSTVLFETGPGHAIRCIQSPYYDDFHLEKIRLKKAGKAHREIVVELERMNTGRLRMASKGVDRRSLAQGTPREIVDVPQEEQFQRGMYMVGQVAAMHHEVVGMDSLHRSVTTDAMQVLQSMTQRQTQPQAARPSPCDVAIVGMSCFYPGANSMLQYWDNILNRVYAVTEIPETHWDWRIFYDENPRAPDKIISKWGGFLGDIPFDPLKFGITPASLKSIEPLQLLMLESVHQALADAGYEHRPFDRENTCAVLGIGGGGSPMGVSYGFRTCLPMLETVDGVGPRPQNLIEACEKMLPEWTEDSFPGILMNVAVGRVANRFDFGGSNYAIDAACASSLAAVHACCRELELGTANVALAMGADTVQTPYAYMAFSKTHALSAQGRCRPFDANADGIVLSEGLGVVVLKRLADAERDGDKIYAVIRGVGSSSDGKDKGLTAPNSAGQLRALRRAYEKAGISPNRVGLIEAHGTGTVVGDRTELQALAQVMADSDADNQSCALGSVKSMIGHTKCAAGVAGLIKATLALHHKVLPPTMVETPNLSANFTESALYLNTAARPWVKDRQQARCAGVSAFGFGGTNVHVVLEEHTNGFLDDPNLPFQRPPAELLVLRRESIAELNEALEQIAQFVSSSSHVPLAELAAVAWRQSSGRNGPTLSIIAEDNSQLSEQLERAKALINQGQPMATDPRGIYFALDPSKQSGKVAMVFPGQGSQYPNMLADMACGFEPVRSAIDRFTCVFDSNLDRPLSRFIYPPSAFSEDQRTADRAALSRTDVAQLAIGAASVGMFELLRTFRIQPDMVAGHSYGELTALWAAGSLNEADFIRLSGERGRCMRLAAGDHEGGMAAVVADEDAVRACLDEATDITLANLNAPDQTVISGSRQALQGAIEKLQTAGIKSQLLEVSCAFHSPNVAAAQAEFAQHLRQSDFAEPHTPVYSNQTARPYGKDADTIREQLLHQITSPVRFRDEIEAMYADGARVFIEVGPHSHLTGLIKRNLGERPYTAIATDVASRHGLTQIMHCLGLLLTVDVPANLNTLFKGRVSNASSLKELEQLYSREHSPTTWMVNGIRSRPWKAAEPRLLGQRGGIASNQSKTDQPNSSSPDPTLPHSPQDKMTHSSNSTHASVAGAPAPLESQSGVTRSEPVRNELASGSLAPPTEPLPAGVDPVMIGFQEVMSQFLEAQRDVMLTYLQGRGGAPANDHLGVANHDSVPIQPPITIGATESHNRRIESIHNDPPPDGENLDPDNTNGIVPISANGSAPHETNGAHAAKAGVSHVPLDTAASGGDTMESISDRLIEIVSQRTGYPREMLNMDLDLEADLGIDSIKRVEILGELAETLDAGSTDDGSLELEKLTAERTLRGMLDYLEHALFSDNGEKAVASSKSRRRTSTSMNGSASAAASSPETTLHISRNNAITDSAKNGDAPDASTEAIQRAKVRLIDIPLQATEQAAIPSATIIVTDDGGGLAVEIVDRLS